jgi:hypothetical protein
MQKVDRRGDLPMRGLALCLLLCSSIGLAEAARGSSKAAAATTVSAGAPASAAAVASCLAELDRRKVAYRRVARRGIAIPVEITSALGGIEVRYHEPLVLDCSLAVSLAEAGHYLRDLGVQTLVVASAHSRRNVRGSSRSSKHSFGLAVDVPALEGPKLGSVRIDRDYEQGLGDDVDCVGAPLTVGGELLKIAQCQLVRSGLFYLVLSPDYDDAHHDHFHLEARPWQAREQLRSSTPAIH